MVVAQGGCLVRKHVTSKYLCYGECPAVDIMPASLVGRFFIHNRLSDTILLGWKCRVYG